MNTRSDYSAEIVNGVLVIIDQNKGRRSVTNNAETVLMECKNKFGDEMPSIAIYRDSDGDWDGLRHESGVFQNFYFLDTRNINIAIERAKKYVLPGSVPGGKKDLRA